VESVSQPETTGNTQAQSITIEARTVQNLPERDQDAPAEVAQAEALLKAGNITAARLWLSRAASRGNAQAVFRLAETYDPNKLAEWSVVGLTSDLGKARELYGRALTLGYQPAQERLAGLAGSSPMAPNSGLAKAR